MTGLRTIWGVDSTRIYQEFGSVFQENFILKIQPFIDQNLIALQLTTYTLTASGMLLTDYITSSLFVV
jgi:oxygen-independent coproporphyrinogen-3 oxidase